MQPHINTIASITSLKADDLPAVSALQPAEWPDIMPHARFYVSATHCYPIKVVIEGALAGIGTSIIHNDIAWLAHIIVHPDYRGKGIGALITKTLIDDSNHRHCNTIYLIATDLGAPVYEKLGFETEEMYLFFKDIKGGESEIRDACILTINDDHLHQIAALDMQVSGEERMFYIADNLEGGYVYVQDGVVEGYYLPQLGDGAIIALNAGAGEALMKLRMHSRDTAAFPAANTAATSFMYSCGYKEFKQAKRMRLGAKRHWAASHIYNRIGGNLG